MKRAPFLILLFLFAAIWGQRPAPFVEASDVQLFLNQTCSPAQPGRVSASFAWQGSDPAALQQWVDLSLQDNGWQPGTFLGVGPFTASTASFVWDGLLGGAVHYIRVNQQLAGGAWDASATFFFETPDCDGRSSPAALAIARLGTLQVSLPASMTGYSREQFGPAWADVDHNGCDTRNDVLQRDLIAVVLRAGSTCIVETGTLLDPYTGKTINFVRGVGTSSEVQIDHVVALAAAWRTGAAAWTPDKRLQFANDPEHLLAADGPTNSSKSDSDAAEWLPPHPDFRCAYVIIQVTIKVKYTLWVTPGEHDAMADTLAHCDAASVPVNPVPPSVSVSVGGPTSVITPPPLEAGCSPAYPDVCISPPPPDLNCGDVPYKRFRVLAPDPHGFDGDHDGIGCEG